MESGLIVIEVEKLCSDLDLSRIEVSKSTVYKVEKYDLMEVAIHFNEDKCVHVMIASSTPEEYSIAFLLRKIKLEILRKTESNQTLKVAV